MNTLDLICATATTLIVFALAYRLLQKKATAPTPRHRPEFSPMSSINIGNIRSGRSTISINGMSIAMEGQHLYVNGQEWGPLNGPQTTAPIAQQGSLVLEADGTLKGPFNGEIHVYGHNVTLTITGDVNGNIDSGSSVNVQGNVSGDVDAGNGVNIGGSVQGDVDAGNSVKVDGNVGGNVDAGGSTTVNTVSGNVDAGGSVTATTIKGKVDAGGNVIHR